MRKPNPDYYDPVKVAKKRAERVMAGWVEVPEAAEMLGVSVRRVRDFLLSGRLPAMRLAHVWLIKKEEIIKFAQIPRIPGKPVPDRRKRR